MAEAVTTWSPVIMTGLMPALRQTRDGLLCLGTGRVDHADQSEEGQPVFQLFAGGLVGHLVDLLVADGEHAQRIRAHGVVDLAGGFDVAAHAELGHDVERALDDDDSFPSIALTVVISLRSESKGISARRGYSRVQGVLRACRAL